jgi:hypothetical protein
VFVSGLKFCRFCLAHGTYTLELEDTALWANYRRNAKTIFSYPSSVTVGEIETVTLFGTMTQSITLSSPAIDDNSNQQSGDDDWVSSASFLMPVILFPILVVVILLWYVRCMQIIYQCGALFCTESLIHETTRCFIRYFRTRLPCWTSFQRWYSYESQTNEDEVLKGVALDKEWSDKMSDDGGDGGGAYHHAL